MRPVTTNLGKEGAGELVSSRYAVRIGDVDVVLISDGILPLPNLETKIVAANTLLGLARGQLQLTDERVRRLEAELQQVRHDYFT
ncbi:MAG: hypothetical protein K6T31_06060, partial [Alicyclobacillus sp.]|nr:hypothetical protein [Alicyclobacillus sp.]